MPYFVDNRLKDGSEVVSLTRRSREFSRTLCFGVKLPFSMSRDFQYLDLYVRVPKSLLGVVIIGYAQGEICAFVMYFPCILRC
jgi:hypothetical protein